MCLATVFIVNDGTEVKAMDKVKQINNKGTDPFEVQCIDLFGQTLNFRGVIQRIDLVNNNVFIHENKKEHL